MAKSKKGRRRSKRDAGQPVAPMESVPSQAATLSPRTWLIFAAIVGATCLAYTPAFRGSCLWDDDAHVTKPELRSAAGLYRIWFEPGATQQYYPLAHSAFWLEHKLWGDNVLGYHLANVLLHATAACLAYLLLKRLAIPGAWLAAMIFALHPLHVESVAWISEQKNTLSAVFYLAAMLTYLRFDENRNKRHYALSLTLFALALLCKTVTATLPAAIFVIFWWRRGKIAWRRDVLPLAPFFVLGFVAGLFTAWVERNFIGAQGGEHELALLDRVLIAGRAPWFYLAKILWPANLAFIYPRWNVDPGAVLQWLFPIATIAVTALFVWLAMRWRTPLTCWLLFVGTLFPVLGFLNVYPFLFSFVANHFAYLASLAIVAPLAALIVAALQRKSKIWQQLGYVLCFLLIAALGIRTWQESHIYSDAATLYQTTLRRNPASWLAHNNLGFEFARQGKSQAAIEKYETALRLKPDYTVAHFNLANQLVALGDLPGAIEHYRTAISIRPGYAEAHNNLGTAYVRQENVQAALQEFKLATQLNPSLADAYSNLGFARLKIGDTSHAIGEFRHALKLIPDFARAHKGLADAFVKNGQLQAAVAHYEQALAANSDNAELRNNLGIALASLGRVADAVKHFEAATKLPANNPEVFKAYAHLTQAYVQLNRPDDAAATAEKAIQVARSQNQPALAAQIETWLTQFRAQRSQSNTESAIETVPPSTQPPNEDGAANGP
jgi:Tfp pilus assembly protein PilF